MGEGRWGTMSAMHIEQQLLTVIPAIKELVAKAPDIKFEFTIPSGTRYFFSTGEARVVFSPTA